jgi:hypothetical protein
MGGRKITGSPRAELGRILGMIYGKEVFQREEDSPGGTF